MAVIVYKGPEKTYTGYVLRPGDPYRYDNAWVIDRDDGFYKFGLSRSYTALTTGDYSGTTNITVNGKTESKSNACVLDNRTGLIWTKTPSGSVGPASDGLLRWDDHVDVITHDGANGGYVAGELLTQDTTGDTALIRYVDDANNKIAVVNPSTRPFGFANTISSPSGGPDTIQAWQQGAKEDIWSYVNAANTAELAGRSDWRVPNLTELLNIMYYSVTNGNAEPDNIYFTMPTDTTQLIWTGSHEGSYDRQWQPVAGYDFDNADAVRFDTGYIYTDNTAWKANTVGYVYLVCGPATDTYPCMHYLSGNYSQAAGHFPDDAFNKPGVARSWTYINLQTGQNHTARDGTLFSWYDYYVQDNLSDLMWTNYNSSTSCPYYDEDGQRFDAIDAVRLANADKLMGYTDWRLPNLFETASLMLGFTRGTAYVLGDYLQDTWTCTPDPNDPTKVFYASYGGYFGVASRTAGGSKYIRLVRGGVTDTSI